MTRWVAIVLLGCGGTTVVAAPEPAVVSPPASVSSLVLEEGTTLMDGACDDTERCDGVDGDCDGHIDEGCESAYPGAIEIALAWNTDADLDLEVTAPGEPVLVRTPCHGSQMERATMPEAAVGEYTIDVYAVPGCEYDLTVASISVSALGRSLGSVNRTVSARTRTRIASFEIR